MLALSDDPCTPPKSAYWVGPLIALGARASRASEKYAGRQLIIAISVPRRDFAAALIGCGWVMAGNPPAETDPLTVLRGLKPHTLVRMVTTRDVIVDYFAGLNEATQPPRAHIGKSTWQVSMIKALGAVDPAREPAKMRRPSPGALGSLAGIEDTWDRRLASPSADLAIVGTSAWLMEELDAFVSRDGEGPATGESPVPRRSDEEAGDALATDSLRQVLLPDVRHAATWFTKVYSSARFADQIPIANDSRAIVLDGFGATKYLADIETPIVVCILDRSVADETATEIVVQMRNTRGEPISVRNDLGWIPPLGVEALAFTVAL